jgi:hypothetical protein
MKNFKRHVMEEYVLEPFKDIDRFNNTLADARDRKIEKYELIINRAKQWFEANLEQIQIKHKISGVRVEVKYNIIPSLGIVLKDTETDVWGIVSFDKKEKLRYGRMWLKRMVNQDIRGSFVCYVNAGRVVDYLDQLAEINEDITNLDDSINLNLWALNELIRFNLKFKEKLSVKGWKLNNCKSINPKHFITLLNLDRGVALEKNVIQSITNLLEADESDIILESEPELASKYTMAFTRVDRSDSNEANEGDIEAEVVESNAIFDNDGLVSDQNDYVKSICIFHSSKSGFMAKEKLKRGAMISANSFFFGGMSQV